MPNHTLEERNKRRASLGLPPLPEGTQLHDVDVVETDVGSVPVNRLQANIRAAQTGDIRAPEGKARGDAEAERIARGDLTTRERIANKIGSNFAEGAQTTGGQILDILERIQRFVDRPLGAVGSVTEQSLLQQLLPPNSTLRKSLEEQDRLPEEPATSAFLKAALKTPEGEQGIDLDARINAGTDALKLAPYQQGTNEFIGGLLTPVPTIGKVDDLIRGARGLPVSRTPNLTRFLDDVSAIPGRPGAAPRLVPTVSGGAQDAGKTGSKAVRTGADLTAATDDIVELENKLMKAELDIEDVTAQIDEISRVVRPPRSNVRVSKTGKTSKVVAERHRQLDKLTNQELIRLAQSEGRDPFSPDWFDSLDSEVVRVAVKERSFRQPGDLTLPALKRQRNALRNELDDITEQLRPKDAPMDESVTDYVARLRQEGGDPLVPEVPRGQPLETPGSGPGLPPRTAADQSPRGPGRRGPRPPRIDGQGSLPPEQGGTLLPSPRSIDEIASTQAVPNAARRIGQKIAGPDANPLVRNTIGAPVRVGAPDIAYGESTIERLPMIQLVQRDEAARAVDVAMAWPQSLGTSEGLFGRTDPSTGLFVGGKFDGFALNELAENPTRFGLDDTQHEFLRRLRSIDGETKALGKREGIEIGSADISSVEFFAGRVVLAKQGDDGLVRVGYVNKGRRLASKVGSEHAREFPTVKEAIKEGYVYLNYETAVRVRAQSMYNRVNDKRLADYIIEHAKESGATVRRLGPRQGAKAGEEFLDTAVEGPFARTVIWKDEAGEKVLGVVRKLQETQSIHPFLRGVADVNAVQRVMALALDNSAPGIQLLPLFFRHPLAGLKSERDFARQWFRAVRNPEAAKAWHAQQVADNADLFRELPGLITTRSGTEITESLDAGIIEKIVTTQGKKGWVPRQINRFAAEPFRIAYESQMDMAGIYTGKGLRHMAKNAQDADVLANYVNKIRGLTSSARTGVGARQRILEAIFLLAPRYRRATFALMADAAQGGLRGELARQAIGSLVIGMTLTYSALNMALGALQGKDIDQIFDDMVGGLNPRDKRFLLFRAGDSVFGFGSKFVQDIRLWTKLLTNDPLSSQGIGAGFFTDDDVIDNPVIRSVRSQLAGVPAKLIDLIEGENVVGEPFDLADPKSVAKNLGDFAVPIWAQAALEGDSLKQKAILGGADFIGGRSFPQGATDILETEAPELIGKPYDEAEQFERQLLRMMAAERLGPAEERAKNVTSEISQYFRTLDDIEQRRISKLQALAEQSEFDYLRYLQIEAEAKGERRQAGNDVEFEGRDPSGPNEQALEQWNAVFTNEAYYDRAGNFSKSGQTALNTLEARLTPEQRAYVLRNTNRRPVPRALLTKLPRARSLSIQASQNAREQYLRQSGRANLIPYARALFYLDDVGATPNRSVIDGPSVDAERQARRERLGLEPLLTP